jgi:hypothetical protein
VTRELGSQEISLQGSSHKCALPRSRLIWNCRTLRAQRDCGTRRAPFTARAEILPEQIIGHGRGLKIDKCSTGDYAFRQSEDRAMLVSPGKLSTGLRSMKS